MEIRELIGLWESGRSTAADESRIREYFRSQADVPEELRPYALLFGGFDALTCERCGEAEGAPGRERRSAARTRRRSTLLWAFSASLAALLLVFGLYFGRTPYCYVDGKPVRNLEKALDATSQLKMLDTVEESLSVLDLLGGIDL